MPGYGRRLLVGIGLLSLGACGGSDSGISGPPIGPPEPPITTVPDIVTTEVFTQLAFSQPVALQQAPGDASRWFVAEKAGVIRVFDNNAGVSSATVFLDIRDRVNASGEGGLLGLAFHPDFPVTPEVFVSYTRSGSPLDSYVSRFVSNDNGATLSAASEDVVLTVLQPFTNHNGGNALFGPDGLLYIGFGDGGGGGDPNENGQDPTNLHGTVVRIDVDGAAPYAIPPQNPFAANSVCMQGYGAAPCPEIFAWGLRNPWRFSFDTVTGRLWAGDVGQNAWEEIDTITVGENYGWNDREGAHCFDPPSGCATGFIDPVTEYDHSLGSSVTGGFVYRGTAVPDMVGWYLFGDFISGRIFAIRQDANPGVAPDQLLDTTLQIVSFGQGNDGELYVLDFSSGTIHRLEAAR
jgi:glucose/arabinose dehydrogenase